MKRPHFHRDANEPEIILTLKNHPKVRLVYRMEDPCDLLVQLKDGSWHVLEVKNPEHGHAKRLTKRQKLFWISAAPPPPLVTGPSQALKALKLEPAEQSAASTGNKA